MGAGGASRTRHECTTQCNTTLFMCMSSLQQSLLHASLLRAAGGCTMCHLISAAPRPPARPGGLTPAPPTCTHSRRPPCAAAPPAWPAPAHMGAAPVSVRRATWLAIGTGTVRTTKSPVLRLLATAGSALWSTSSVGGSVSASASPLPAAAAAIRLRVSTMSRAAKTEPSMQRRPRYRRLPGGEEQHATGQRATFGHSRCARTRLMWPSRK